MAAVAVVAVVVVLTPSGQYLPSLTQSFGKSQNVSRKTHLANLMPSTIVKGSQFQSLGITLSSSSCVEQVNGLVEVQTRFFADKSRQAEIDRLFFVDAQPPIDPSCVTKASLLTQRLYMVSRSVSRENGFLAIDASYVGALARPGSRGFYLTMAKGSTIAGFTQLGIGNTSVNVTVVGGTISQKAFFFDYFVNEITVEFVEIGGQSASAIPEFAIKDVFSLVQVKSAFNGVAPIPGPFTAEQVLGEDPQGIANVNSPNYRVFASFSPTLLRTQEPSTFLTPTVKVAKIRFSM